MHPAALNLRKSGWGSVSPTHGRVTPSTQSPRKRLGSSRAQSKRPCGGALPVGSPHPLNLHSAPWSPHSTLLCAQQSLRGWRWWASGRQAGATGRNYQSLLIQRSRNAGKTPQSWGATTQWKQLSAGKDLGQESRPSIRRVTTGIHPLSREQQGWFPWGITLPALTPGPTPHKRGSVTQDARPASPPSQSFGVQQGTRQREGLHLRTLTGQLSKRSSSCWDS